MLLDDRKEKGNYLRFKYGFRPNMGQITFYYHLFTLQIFLLA